MGSLKWSLLVVCFCFKVIQIEASSWTCSVPSKVEGLIGSCVVIPCSFSYPAPKTDQKITNFTGIWKRDIEQFIYHPDHSHMVEQYRNRTILLGQVSKKGCSLKIDPLQQTDLGPFYFRVVMEGYDKFSYRQNKVSITMINKPSPITFSAKEGVVEGQTVSVSCSVSHSCPASPPVFTWNHSGKNDVQAQQLHDEQWSATSTLTFQATSADHNKPLQCTVTYKGGQQQNASKVLKVKHAPVNVKVEYKSDAKEGEAVQLKCSSDAHPPASSYEWHNETSVRLHQGSIYVLNVSRHYTGSLYCTANNTLGQGKSNPVKLNVLYAPEITVGSSCSSEAHMVKCVCIAESKPPSMVHFVLSDRVLQNNTKTKKHDTVTIGTLLAELGSSEFVLCLANNTQGSANLTLYLPVNSKMQSLYIIIAIGAGTILMILLVAVGVIKKCRGRSEHAATSHMSTMKADKDVELPQYAATNRKEKAYDDVQYHDEYINDHVYGNMGIDCDDAIYGNI